MPKKQTEIHLWQFNSSNMKRHIRRLIKKVYHIHTMSHLSRPRYHPIARKMIEADLKKYEVKLCKYYLMVIELKDISAMFNLGLYYKEIEKNYDLMKKYYLMAINSGHTEALKTLKSKHNENSLALYKLLMEVEESSRSEFLKQQLTKLEQDHIVRAYNNKVRIFKRLNNYTQCRICLEENVLNISLDCGHEICIHCYDPNMKCHYRCNL